MPPRNGLKVTRHLFSSNMVTCYSVMALSVLIVIGVIIANIIKRLIKTNQNTVRNSQISNNMTIIDLE